MVEFCVEFEAIDNTFDTEFEGFTPVSDGGFERGYEEGYAQGDIDGQEKGKIEGEIIGYADALSKRTDLAVTENGEYTPTDDSTGFKSVRVSVPERKLLQVVKQTVTEITEDDLQGATQIRSYLFYGCSSLWSVSIPVGVTSIGSYAFAMCSSLTSITFPEGLTIINGQAFMSTSALSSIILPSSLTRLQSQTFWMSGVQSVTVKATKPPTIGSSTFQNCNSLAEIIVPVGTKSAYDSATNWSAYADIIIEGDV